MHHGTWLLPWLYIGHCFPEILAINPSENEIGDPESTSYPHPHSPASEIPFEVDILKRMNVSHKDQGVSLVEGPINKYHAYKFRLPYGNLPLANSTDVLAAMNNSRGFTVVFLYRQQKKQFGYPNFGKFTGSSDAMVPNHLKLQNGNFVPEVSTQKLQQNEPDRLGVAQASQKVAIGCMDLDVTFNGLSRGPYKVGFGL